MSDFPLRIPLDVLVGASESCLYTCNVELEKQIPGKVTFRLRRNDLGDLGTVEITKKSAEVSEVAFRESSAPMDEDGIAYALTAKRSEFSDEWAQVLQSFLEQSRKQGKQASKTFDLFPDLRGDEWRAKKEEFLAQMGRAVGFLKDKRAEHWQWVIQAYFGELSKEPIWLERPAWAPNARLVESLDAPQAAVSGEEQSKADGGQTRALHPVKRERLTELRKLHQNGLTQEEVAEKLQVSVKTVQRYSDTIGLTWK